MLQPEADGLVFGLASRVFAGCWALLNFALFICAADELWFGEGSDWLGFFFGSGLGVVVAVTLLLNICRYWHRWLPEIAAAALLITVVVLWGFMVLPGLRVGRSLSSALSEASGLFMFGSVLGVVVAVTLLLNRNRSFHRLLSDITAAALLITVVVLWGFMVLPGLHVGRSLSSALSEASELFMFVFILGGYSLIPAAFAIPTTVMAAQISRLRPHDGGWVVRGIAWILVVLADLMAISTLLIIISILIWGPPRMRWG